MSGNGEGRVIIVVLEVVDLVEQGLDLLLELGDALTLRGHGDGCIRGRFSWSGSQLSEKMLLEKGELVVLEF